MLMQSTLSFVKRNIVSCANEGHKVRNWFFLSFLQVAKNHRDKNAFCNNLDAIINEFNAYNTDIIDSILLLLESAKWFLIPLNGNL